MGDAAASIVRMPWTKPIWVIILGLWCFIMAVWGPATVVRQWLEKFAIWLVYLSTIWITIQAFTIGHLNLDISFNPGNLSAYLLALDLVIAMPISWAPLVSDYNRFACSESRGFLGTLIGYTIANTWFYTLGAALYLVYPNMSVVASISCLFFGNLALLLILVDETDNAFADIYSTAVSVQNINPRVRQWITSLITTIIGMILAIIIPLEQYENFLLLIGASFIPASSIIIADYFLVRKSYNDEILYSKPYRVNYAGVISWILGFTIYYLLAYRYPYFGASIPTVVFTILIYYMLYNAFKR